MTAPPLAMTDEQRRRWSDGPLDVAPHRKVIQAKALLLAADGVATNEVARRCDTTETSVRAWRRRFETKAWTASVRSHRAGDASRGCPRGPWPRCARHPPRGPRRRLDALDDPLMAKRFGIGKDTVARIWRDHNLKPWQVETFKLSNDPRFEEKLVDVVGLYLNPPERAVVFCFDEKTQVQALDRTQPSLPMKPGRGGDDDP